MSHKMQFLQSLARTACFAAVFGWMVSCSSNQMQTTTPQPSQSTVRLLSHISLAQMAWSHFSARLPLVATIFQTPQPQAAQIQQSFEGLSCGAFNPGAEVNFSHATTGFIPIQVLGDPFIEPSNPSFAEKLACGGVFAQVGGGTDLMPPPPGSAPNTGTLTNPGTVIYTDGSLSTLIVTGRSVAGQQIRCSDTTTTVSVHDLDLVQPYFAIQSNSVVLGIGTNQLPFTCQLNIPAGDSAGSLAVNWVKM